MFHTNSISVTPIILQMKSISPLAPPILITAGFPICGISGLERPDPAVKLGNSGRTATSNPIVITFMQTQGALANTIWFWINGIQAHCFRWWNWSHKIVWCNFSTCSTKLKSTVHNINALLKCAASMYYLLVSRPCEDCHLGQHHLGQHPTPGNYPVSYNDQL